MSEQDKTQVMPDFEFDLDLDTIEVQPQEAVEKQVISEEPSKVEETPQVAETQPEVKTEQKEETTPPVETKVETEEQPEFEIPEGADPAAYGIYSIMVDKGYLTEEEGFKGTYEELNDIFESLPERAFESVVNTLNPKAKLLLQYAVAKGDELNDEELAAFYQEVIDTKPVSIDSEEGQLAFLSRTLTEDGYSEDDAVYLINKWQEEGKLAEKANFFKSKNQDLSEAEQKVQQAKQLKETRKQKTIEFKQTIQQELNKTEWSDRRKNLVLNEIFSGQMREKTANIINHPKALYQLADFMTYLNPKTGEFDLEAYKKQGLTPEIKTIKNSIERKIGSLDFMKGVTQRKEEKNTNKEFEFVID
jgi:hypothetical protein